MSYNRKEEMNQVDAESCSLSGDLSLLDELFPSLGDGGSSSNHFTNQLAFLLNSFNTNEEDGASNGPSLFNPLQLSPPRLNEIHALATANLISQTQEAIMQEYNISDLDFESSNSLAAENKVVAVNNEKSDLSCSSNIEYSAVSISAAVNNCISKSKAENLNCDKIIKDCCFTNLNPHTTEDKNAVKLIDRETNLIDDDHSNILLMNFSKNDVTDTCNDANLNKQVSVLTDSIWTNSDSKTFEKSCDDMVIIKDKVQQDNQCPELAAKENSYQKVLTSLNENLNGVKRMYEENEINFINLSSDSNLECVTKQSDLKHKSVEAESTFKINGQHSEASQLKKKLLKFEQNRDSPLDANHFQNDSCISGETTGQPTNSRVLFMCLKCLKQFNNADDLECHSTNHLQYVCPHPCCIRTFAHRSHFSYHQKVHEKEKSYQCSKCGKIFTKAQHLDVHMRTHDYNKPFVCTVCNKGFTTIGNLKNHSRLHTGERPFACDFIGCDKRFVEMSSLKKHKVTHTGEKSHKCDICGKGFTQVSSKNYHMKKHKDVKGMKEESAKTV